jgi:hypothetical protein
MEHQQARLHELPGRFRIRDSAIQQRLGDNRADAKRVRKHVCLWLLW